MIKYAMNWTFTDRNTNETKSGTTFYVVADGLEYKIDEPLFSSLDCPSLGFKHTFIDNNKNKTSVWFTKEEN